MRINDYFSFLREREQVRLRKEADLSYPWTKDSILSSYKFTNVRRHHDRTSRELIQSFYLWATGADPKEVLMNAALFRYFGTYEFAQAVGWQDYESFNFDEIKALARRRLQKKERVFTGAYVITNQGISDSKENVVVDIFLRGLHEKAAQIVNQRGAGWQETAEIMRQIPGFGGSGFMTKEVLLDTTYVEDFWPNQAGGFSFPDDWMSWTPVGPGARRGGARVLGDDEAKPLSEEKSLELILHLTGRSQLEEYWPQDWGPLSPHDIQFQLCEFDKYERVRLGQGRPRSTYRGPR